MDRGAIGFRFTASPYHMTEGTGGLADAVIERFRERVPLARAVERL